MRITAQIKMNDIKESTTYRFKFSYIELFSIFYRH